MHAEELYNSPVPITPQLQPRGEGARERERGSNSSGGGREGEEESVKPKSRLYC